MSLIVFADGIGYVMTTVPMKRQDFQSTDLLGCTKEESTFAEQFDRIFRAATSGDLTECLQVVEEGYTDFEAVSFGKFRTKTGKPLDNVTPLRAAELHGHRDIVEFFRLKTRFNATSPAHTEPTIAEMLALGAAKKYRTELDQSWDQKQNLKSEYYTRLDQNEGILHSKLIGLLKRISPIQITQWAHHALKSSYTDVEWQEKKQLIVGLTKRSDQIKFFKVRIQQPFNVNSAHSQRVMMMAFVDFTEKKLD